MKKLLTLTVIFALSTPAFAGFQASTTNAGGYNGQKATQQSTTTVAKAKRMYDDAWVRLTGYIVASHGDEKYTFKDNTGSILVEIDHDVWQGLNVTPKTKVRIAGKVDRDDGRVSIDVKRINRAK